MTDDPPDDPTALPVSTPGGLTLEQIEDLMRTSMTGRRVEVTFAKPGFTKPMVLEFPGNVRAIVKLGLEAGGRPAAFHERMCHNEAAVFRLARYLGLEVVPITVIRQLTVNGASVVASLMQWADDSFEPAAPRQLARVDRAQLLKAAAFDYLIAQVDRRGHNWLLVPRPDGSADLKLIDHGLCLNVDMWASAVGVTTTSTDDQPVSDVVDYVRLSGWTPDWSILDPLRSADLDAITGGILLPVQLAGLQRRIARLAEAVAS